MAKLEDLLGIQKMLSCAAGHWPKKNSSVFYKLKEFISFITIFALFIIMSIEVLQNLHDFVELSTSLNVFTSFLGYLIKYSCFRYNRKTFIEILKSLKDPMFKDYPEKYAIHLQNQLNVSKILCRSYMVSCYSCIFFFDVAPLVDRQPLPIKTAYFKRGIMHYPVYLIMSFSLVVCANNNLCMDLTLAGLLQVASAQLDILKAKLMDTEENSIKEVKRFNYETKEKRIFKYLINCCMHYDKIIVLVKNIETIFTVALLAQVCGSIIVICNTGFHFLIVNWRSSQFITLFLYFTCMLAELTMYCWFGNEVILKSIEVGNACYMSNWYNFDENARKTLFLLMERCKRPLTVSTYKFSVLSLPTFMKIMNWSYSYFTLLRRVYSDGGFQEISV